MKIKRKSSSEKVPRTVHVSKRNFRLLDLYCGGGGAAVGYYQAGFKEIVGVDILTQSKYPFQFVQYDALTYLRDYGHLFDAIHASPPCQAYTTANFHGKTHPDMIPATRDLLIETGKPYVIENVPYAPLHNAIWLEGTLFNLKVYRRRGFECSFFVPQPDIPPRTVNQAPMGRPVKEGEFIQCVGHFSNVPYGRVAMGISWLGQGGLAQAIPPAYTKYIGQYLLQYISERCSISV